MNKNVKKFIKFVNEHLSASVELDKIVTFHDPYSLRKIYTQVNLQYDLNTLWRFSGGEIDVYELESKAILPIMNYFSSTDLTFKLEDFVNGKYDDNPVVFVTFYYGENAKEFDVEIEHISLG